MVNYYLIGLFLGDGFISIDNILSTGEERYKFGIVVNEWNYEEIKENIPNSFELDWIESKNGLYKYKEVFTKDIKFTYFMKDLCGCNSKSKHFPIGLCRESFWELLAGLVDSDGGVTENNMYFKNSSSELILGVSIWLDKLGIEYSLRDSNDNCKIITIRQASIKDVKIKLRTEYKNIAFERLKIKSTGRRVAVTPEFIERNKIILKQLLCKSTYWRVCNGKTKYIYPDIFLKCADDPSWFSRNRKRNT